MLTRYLTLLTLCLGLAVTSCTTEGTETPPVTPPTPDTSQKPLDKGRRTVLVYVNAQNSLGYQRFQDLDSLEMAQGADYIDDNDRFLVYLDDDEHPRILRFQKGQKGGEIVKRFNEERCSSDPETLREVLNWTRLYYPAGEYGLVLWSHADGWLPSPNKDYRTSRSFGIDVGDDGNMATDYDANGNIGAGMDIDDMADAISRTGLKLKYIFFDACLMQCIETDYALRDVADYVIGSPLPTPAYGSHYTNEIRRGFFSDDVTDIAKTYYNDIMSDTYADMYYDYGCATSVVQTDQLDSLALVTRELLPQYIEGQNQADMTDVMQYLTYSSRYFYRPEFFDAGSAMRHVLSDEDYTRWRTYLDRAVIYKQVSTRYWIGPGNYTYGYRDNDYAGLSMFVPQWKYSNNADYCLYGDLNAAFRETAWYAAAGWSATGW